MNVENVGFQEFGDLAERIAAIANVFPVFFFFIAALITFTTMTRMVEENRREIGTLKALGYTKVEIAKKYAIYANASFRNRHCFRNDIRNESFAKDHF